MQRIKKNDKVIVLSGKDKDQMGTVIDILPAKNKILVKDIGMVTLHVKARKQGEVAGIKKRESFIDMAKAMPVCSSCSKPCRVNYKISESGEKSRICNKCKEIF